MMDALTPIADVVLDLPLCPSTNNLFATGAAGRRFKSAEYTDWIEEAGWRLNAQRPRPIAGKVALMIEVEEPKTNIAQDCTNRIKAVEDLLVTHGIIKGDDQRYVREVTVRWADVTGVRVTIRSCS